MLADNLPRKSRLVQVAGLESRNCLCLRGFRPTAWSKSVSGAEMAARGYTFQNGDGDFRPVWVAHLESTLLPVSLDREIPFVSLGEPSQTVETTRWLTSTGWAQWTQLLRVLTRWRLLTAELRRGSLGRDVRSFVASHLPCRQ